MPMLKEQLVEAVFSVSQGKVWCVEKIIGFSGVLRQFLQSFCGVVSVFPVVSARRETSIKLASSFFSEEFVGHDVLT